MAELNGITALIGDANLKAYYRFETGALTTDSSGEGHTLTAISDPAEGTGKFGGGVVLDGNDGYSIANHADFQLTGNWSIGGWVNLASAVGFGTIFASWYNSGSVYAGVLLDLGSDGLHPRLVSAKNTGTSQGTDFQLKETTGAITTSTWNLIVGTFDGSTLRIYINNSAPETIAWANNAAFNASNQVRFGCESDTGASDQAFINGNMDDTFVFKGTVLSDAQILQLYTDAVATGRFRKYFI